MHVSQQLKSTLENVPILGDVLLSQFIFRQRKTACRGVFTSYGDAQKEAARLPVAGYDQPLILGHEDPAALTASATLGTIHDRDYPVLFYLSRIIGGCRKVCNLGGNVGIEYYSYRSLIEFPAELDWTICEINSVVEAGRRIAEKEGARRLYFTSDFSACTGSDVLLSCGTLQYLEQGLAEILRPIPDKPRHIIVNRVPLSPGPAYFTLQNIGYSFCPYRVDNEDEFVTSVEEMGYKRIAGWKDERRLRVPFHPQLTVQGYSGFYFRRKQ